MRTLAVLLLFGLAGCVGGADPSLTELQGPVSVEEKPRPPPVQLANGDYVWHGDLARPGGANATKMVVQALLDPCVVDGQVFEGNRRIPVEVSAPQPIQPGSLAFGFQWDVTDFHGDHVFLAVLAPGHDDYLVLGPARSGERYEVFIEPTENSTQAAWDLWACLDEYGWPANYPEWQGGPFYGAFQFDAAFKPGRPQPVRG